MTAKASCQTCFCGRNKQRAALTEKAKNRRDNYFGFGAIMLLTFAGLTLIFC